MKTSLRGRMLGLCLAALILIVGPAQAGAAESFSFIAMGDTRTESYLTGGIDQADMIKKALRIKEQKGRISLSFNAKGTALVSAQVEKGDNLTEYTYSGGWPKLITKTIDGEQKIVMRDLGRKWVMDRIVSDIRRGVVEPDLEPTFVVHGGDFILHGFQGKSLSQSPYWQLFDKELISRLPAPDLELGLPGRLLGAVGNHESWGDKNLVGMLSTMPWLGDLGLSPDRRIFALKYRNCRFIFLDAGGYCKKGTCWDSRYPEFKEQMAFLQEQLYKAKEDGAKHVFVVYHKPSFAKVGHDPLPQGQNPHPYLSEYAAYFNIVVFNSHNHTTEHYFIDGIHYLTLGGGGAPQKFTPAKHPSPQEELYWAGQPRVEEYSFLKVEIDGPRVRGVLNRFRPTDPMKPLGVVEMFSLAPVEEDR